MFNIAPTVRSPVAEDDERRVAWEYIFVGAYATRRLTIASTVLRSDHSALNFTVRRHMPSFTASIRGVQATRASVRHKFSPCFENVWIVCRKQINQSMPLSAPNDKNAGKRKILRKSKKLKCPSSCDRRSKEETMQASIGSLHEPRHECCHRE
jgi:hypothetical protein